MSRTTPESFALSSPGKIILFGEHAVVYDKTAIATSIDLRTKCTVSPIEENATIQISFISPTSEIPFIVQWNFEEFISLQESLIHHFGPLETNFSQLEQKVASPSLIQFFDEHIEKKHIKSSLFNGSLHCFLFLTLHLFNFSNKISIGIEFNIISNIPIKAGLGSSASFNVSLVASILSCHLSVYHAHHIQLRQLKLILDLNNDEKKVNPFCHHLYQWTFLAEKIIHGRPSGIDNTICTYGSTLAFRSGDYQFITNHILEKFHFIILDTGIQRNTAEIVQSVKNRYEHYHEIYEAIFDAIDSISEKVMHSIKCHDKDIEQHLLNLIPINQSLLCSLDVSHPLLDRIFQFCQENQLAGKLTGAGKGGCFFILLPSALSQENIQSLKQKISSHFKVSLLDCKFNQPGLMLHESVQY